MKPTGSLKTDPLPNEQDPGDWRWARNVVLNKRQGALSIEDGVTDITPTIGGTGTAAYPSSKSCIGVYENSKKEKIFFFSADGTGSGVEGEIGRIKADGKYYPIIKDATNKQVLDLRREAPVQVVGEIKFNNNTIIVWTDATTELKVLNIDCIPFKLDSDFTVNSADVSKAKALIKLFFDYKMPTITSGNLSINEGQGSLSSGVYYPIVGYEADDGSVTSWSEAFNGIPIYSSNINGQSTTISGGKTGDSTSKGITIKFTNVDTNYRKLRVGYIYVKGGITTAYFEKSQLIDKSSTDLQLILTGGSQTLLNLDEVLIPNIIYKTAKTATGFQKSLYIANLVQEDDINYQTYANSIVVNWVRDKEVRINGAVRDSGGSTYQDPAKAFFDKGFKSAECYAFYIRLRRKRSGTHTKWFHIPGRAANAGDRDVLNPGTANIYANIDGGANVYKYQILNTHTQTTQTKGTMGFWENENEFYPVDPANPTTAVHPDYANIPSITYNARKVRHHVFPDLTYLDNGGNTEKFITGSLIGSAGTFPVNDIKSKIFGIEVSNVNIPSSISDDIDSWEIGYAERGSANIRVIGSDCASDEDSSAPNQWFRFQQFDSMVSRPNLSITYIKPLYEFRNDGAVTGEEANFVEDLFSSAPVLTSLKVSPVNESIYLGENTTIPYNNSGFADNMYLRNPLSLYTGYAFGMGVTLTNQYVWLFDLCIYRRNVYVSFSNQTVVSTGYTFKVAASGVQSAQNVYGGDIFINRHSVNPLNTGTKALSYVCESAANIGLRNEDVSQSKYFSPKYSNPSPSWYGYNRDFSALNKYNQEAVYFPSETCIGANVTQFPNRIAYSIVDGDESSLLNWRIFKANSYYDNVKDKGEIWNIKGTNRTLFIHHKYSLFIAELKDSLRTEGQEIALKSSGVFDRPPQEIVPTSESKGFAGTQSKWACISCKLGYCFIDKEAKKIFIFNSNGLKEVSDQGMFNFFFDNILSKDDELLGGTDNPFNGEGYLMSYDEKNNRLIIVKRAIDFGQGAYEFTISYSPEADEGKGGWVSFHDYAPHYIFDSRDGLFSITNTNGSKKFYKHNDETKKAKYYDGAIKESFIDIVHNENSNKTKRYDSISWITNSEINAVNYPQETFTHLMVYNETQCSGKVNCKAAASGIWYSKNRRNVEGQWYFNTFRDLTKVVTNPFLDSKNELITSNIDSAKSWYKKSKFISKFVIFRLINDNTAQKDLHLSSFDINFIESSR